MLRGLLGSTSPSMWLQVVLNPSNTKRLRIRDLAEKQYKKVPSGDVKPNSWTLLDFGDVVVHIFLPEQREFYNLEEFYGNAIPIELPFDAQSSFHS